MKIDTYLFNLYQKMYVVEKKKVHLFGILESFSTIWLKKESKYNFFLAYRFLDSVHKSFLDRDLPRFLYFWSSLLLELFTDIPADVNSFANSIK